MRFGRWQSRVRGLPEYFGELPASALAEEIDTPGEGQVRALVTVAGNPFVSTPNSGRLERAVEALDFMLAIDIYVNETTRHADVILPAPEPLEKSHYDLALYQLAARNVANFSPPVFEREGPAEWEVFMRLAGIVGRPGAERRRRRLRRHGHPDADPARGGHGGLARGGPRSRRAARGARAAPRPRARARLPAARGPLRRRLRRRPRGADARRARAAARTAWTSAPLAPRLPEVLRTASGKIELAPEAIVGDIDRLRAAAGARAERRLRADRPAAAALEQLVDAQPARAREGQGALHAVRAPGRRRAARAWRTASGASGDARPPGAIEVPVEVTDEIMPGVVSIPHGWGHDADGVRMGVASAHAGVNSNVLADESHGRAAVRERRAERHPGRGERGLDGPAS